MKRSVSALLGTLVAISGLPGLAAGQEYYGWPPDLEVDPRCPSPEGKVWITLSGLWSDSGAPWDAVLDRKGNVIEIRLSATLGTLPVITPWSQSVDAGRLPAGEYTIYAMAIDQVNVLRPRTLVGTFVVDPACPAPCYANCDGSTAEPILTVDDFTCFINEFAAAQALPVEEQIEHYANCDGSTSPPILTVDDFTCFINEFAQGCP